MSKSKTLASLGSFNAYFNFSVGAKPNWPGVTGLLAMNGAIELICRETSFELTLGGYSFVISP